MKAKRVLCMLAAILLVVAMMLMFLTGCNRTDKSSTRHSAMTMLSWRFPMVQSSAGKSIAGKTMMTAIRFR